jgi:hypothetical protein
MRPRLAPKASRTAISLCRPAARASSIFAILAHATSRTNPTSIMIPATTALNRISSVLPIKDVCCRATVVVWSRSGNVRANCSTSRLVSACARAIVIAGCKRPRTCTCIDAGSSAHARGGASCVCMEIGAQKSVNGSSTAALVNFFGATPATV